MLTQSNMIITRIAQVEVFNLTIFTNDIIISTLIIHLNSHWINIKYICLTQKKKRKNPQSAKNVTDWQLVQCTYICDEVVYHKPGNSTHLGNRSNALSTFNDILSTRRSHCATNVAWRWKCKQCKCIAA